MTSAAPTVCAASTAVRCCRSKPGFCRPARICSSRNGCPVTSDNANEVRRICPPPSPCDPSIVIICKTHFSVERSADTCQHWFHTFASILRPFTVLRHLDQLRIKPAEHLHEVRLGRHN